MSDPETTVDAVHRRSPSGLGPTVWIIIPVAVTMALLLLLLATGDPAVDRAERSPLVGRLTPEISGTTTTGEAFDIDAERGRWVVVNFFSTTCIPCVNEHPELVAFQEGHSSAADATIVSVAFDDSAANVVDFFAEYGGDWPVLAADTGGIAVRYGVTGVPESYIVAPSGVVAQKRIGGVTADDLDAVIDALEEAAT
ncbi:MAG: TlpA family protein disulfide reductase [Acidimicrobiales bacterium]